MSKNHTRYIFSIGTLSRKDNSIAFANQKGNFYIPIEGVRELYCMNEVSFNTKFLDFISKAGINLHIFNYYGHYSGTYFPKKQLVSGSLVVKQALAYKDQKELIAKSIVKGIANNIHEVLYHYYRHDTKSLKPLLEWLKKDVPSFLEKDISSKQILFIEGQIWSKFYDSFELFLDESFQLKNRKKRPPDNPMNAMISFGNSMLYARTISQIYHTHLEQSISFLHEPREGRFSLSLDISEVFKPIIVYKTIFDLVNRKKIQASKHFEKSAEHCLLNVEGRKIFVESYEERINQVFMHSKLKRKTTYKNAIKLDGYKLVKHLVEGVEFVPFSLKEKR